MKRARDKQAAAPASSTAKQSRTATTWTVKRIAVKDIATRKSEGGEKSPQRKLSCTVLTAETAGAVGEVPLSLLQSLFRGGKKATKMADYNNYRTGGHKGRFEAGTNDRAISVGTVAAYETLRATLPGVTINDGDLGENILLDGPSALAGADLAVGTHLQIGGCVLALTEANNPCYRFNRQPWVAAAKAAFAADAPEPSKWFKAPSCPLNHEINPGVRGWLAKVVREGEVRKGDEVKKVKGGRRR